MRPKSRGAAAVLLCLPQHVLFSGEAALRSWLRGSVELHVAWGIFFFSFPATIKKINLIRNSLSAFEELCLRLLAV